MPTRRVLLVLSALLASGCTSGPGTSLADFFPDADARWGLVADGGFSESHSFVVPDSAQILIARAAFEADRGMHFTIYDPRNQISSNFVFNRAVAVKEVFWEEAIEPRDGTWRIGVDCVRRCQFAFGFYFDAELPPPANLDGHHTGTTRRFEARSDGGGVRVHEFDVPKDSESLRLQWSLDASDRIHATLRNPAHTTRFGFTLPHASRVDNAFYEAVVMPAEGKWSVAVLCDGRCHYVFGVTY